jgi:hypothetical protein
MSEIRRRGREFKEEEGEAKWPSGVLRMAALLFH